MLANHNPNTNEANSASRKLCELLEEGNFKGLFNEKIPNIQTNVRSPNMGYVKCTVCNRIKATLYKGMATVYVCEECLK